MGLRYRGFCWAWRTRLDRESIVTYFDACFCILKNLFFRSLSIVATVLTFILSNEIKDRLAYGSIFHLQFT